MEQIRYQIDALDEITDVSDSWATFAIANDTPQLATGVVGHPIWEFVGDHTTRQVYRDLISRVRDGRTVTFSYRCDSPALRRFMQMTLTPQPRKAIQFDSITLRTESRVPLNFAAPTHGRADWLLRVCSWCKRVAVGDEWAEVEVAVERLGLFVGTAPVAITHGMCAACVTRVEAETAA